MLSDPERQKKLADWLELDGHDRPGGVKRWRRRVTWAVFLLCLGAVVVAAFVPRSGRAVQPGPVSSAHAALQDNCANCHREPMVTASRFLPWNSHARGVPNDGCINCHGARPHNDFVSGQSFCADCHREHRGQSLKQVKDSFCLDCHRNLKAHHTSPSQARAEDVSGFPSGHPEFALWRGKDDRFRGSSDPSHLRFNHRKHLVETGVFKPDKSFQHLECKNCHVPDESGATMQPIRYEKHCAECHPLLVRLSDRFEGPVVEKLAQAFNNTPVPHRPPSEVRAVLRERLVELYQAATPMQSNDVEVPRTPLPGRPLVTEVVWRQVKSGLKESEELLFLNRQQGQVERGQLTLAIGCAECHIEKERQNDGLPVYKPSSWRSRPDEHWLRNARFDHRSHQTTHCTACHAGADLPATQSERTSDVLLPHLATCAGCHNPTSGVRNDCICCHTYHPAGHEKSSH